LFVALLFGVALVLFGGGPPPGAADDHEQARALRRDGDILPLAEVLRRPELAGLRVLEAELEREHDRLVYELELLDGQGRVQERYFDARTGQPLATAPGD
jgi:uncharacterized membrane protein YkoI